MQLLISNTLCQLSSVNVSATMIHIKLGIQFKKLIIRLGSHLTDYHSKILIYDYK